LQKDLSQAVLPLQPTGSRHHCRNPWNHWTAGYRNTTDPSTRRSSRQTPLAGRTGSRLFALLIGSLRRSRWIPRASTGYRPSRPHDWRVNGIQAAVQTRIDCSAGARKCQVDGNAHRSVALPPAGPPNQLQLPGYSMNSW
jgi:hypothetical protein